MGCTDILGIPEIKAGAKMISTDVGLKPFKRLEKGGLEGGWGEGREGQMGLT